ncbi:hypothetical protein ACH40D_41915 [Streptomyces olivaceoviridis]|uniref:hypothetical protein n=1 Tax=Streptomyces TaxID=1883 RepID=UPI001FC9F9A1|nr:hypothetical protein [Streptomyces corchorusii]
MEAAAACGWRYSVVTGWRPHAMGVLDAISAQRRDLDDPLALQAQLLLAAEGRSVRFGDLVAATALPVVARAHALHLIWHRQLGADLGEPLRDASEVWPGAGVRR